MMKISAILLLIGCNQTQVPLSATGVVQITNIPQGEEVFKELGRNAWIYKYHGGDLTAEFNIYYQAAGEKNESLIRHNNGDQVIRRNSTEAEGNSPKDPGVGYLIVVVPQIVGKSEDYIFSFSSVSGARIELSSDLPQFYPASIQSSKMNALQGISNSETFVRLQPGETKQLLNFKRQYWDGNNEDAGSLRFEIIASAVKDGKVPSREDKKKALDSWQESYFTNRNSTPK